MRHRTTKKKQTRRPARIGSPEPLIQICAGAAVLLKGVSAILLEDPALARKMKRAGEKFRAALRNGKGVDRRVIDDINGAMFAFQRAANVAMKTIAPSKAHKK